MKLTKLIIASLLAIESTHFANAKSTNPFAKKADVMNLVGEIQANEAKLATSEKKENEVQAKIDDLGYDKKKEKECTDAGMLSIRRSLSSYISLGDDAGGDEKKGDEKKGDEKKGDEEKGDEKKGDEEKGDEKKGDEEKGDEEKGDDEEAKKKLQGECDALKPKKVEKDKLDEELKKYQTEAKDVKPKIEEGKSNLVKLNPGLNPATLDTIKGSMAKDGKFDFLIPEVDESSKLTWFKAFIKKLEVELDNWAKIEKLDKAEVDKGDDKKALYEARLKADAAAVKTVSDFKTSLTTISKSLGTDEETLAGTHKSALKVAIAQYEHDAVSSNMKQAITLQKIDTDNEATYVKYAKDMKEILGELNAEIKNAASGSGDNTFTYLVIGAVATFVIFGSIAAFKMCNKKKD